jgi:hypothetical protein
MLGVIITLLVAIVSGLITGCVLRLELLNQVSRLDACEDTNYYMDAKFTLFGRTTTRTNALSAAIDLENGTAPLNLHPVY